MAQTVRRTVLACACERNPQGCPQHRDEHGGTVVYDDDPGDLVVHGWDLEAAVGEPR